MRAAFVLFCLASSWAPAQARCRRGVPHGREVRCRGIARRQGVAGVVGFYSPGDSALRGLRRSIGVAALWWWHMGSGDSHGQ
jgi:hypothetical protein